MAKSGIDVDMKAWSKALTKIENQVLPKTVREIVNSAAFAARPAMSEMLKSELDRPISFTLRPWQVIKAKASPDLDSIAATIKPLDRQESYLAYQLFGGRRHGGDPGAWPSDIPIAPEDHQNKFGNRVRSLLKRIQKFRREEKEIRKAGFARLLRVKTFEGFFFGVVGGVRGYYRRPARKQLEGPKKRGVIRSENLSPPDLMIAVYPSTKHKEKLRGPYDELVNKAMEDANAKFGEFFAEQMRRAGVKK